MSDNGQHGQCAKTQPLALGIYVAGGVLLQAVACFEVVTTPLLKKALQSVYKENWLTAAQSVVTVTMRVYVTEDSIWDAFAVTTILSNFLRKDSNFCKEVLRQQSESPHIDEQVHRLLQWIKYVRTANAHPGLFMDLSETEVLEAIKNMTTVLECMNGCEPQSLAELAALQQDLGKIVQQAGDSSIQHERGAEVSAGTIVRVNAENADSFYARVVSTTTNDVIVCRLRRDDTHMSGWVEARNGTLVQRSSVVAVPIEKRVLESGDILKLLLFASVRYFERKLESVLLTRLDGVHNFSESKGDSGLEDIESKPLRNRPNRRWSDELFTYGNNRLVILRPSIVGSIAEKLLDDHVGLIGSCRNKLFHGGLPELSESYVRNVVDSMSSVLACLSTPSSWQNLTVKANAKLKLVDELGAKMCIQMGATEDTLHSKQFVALAQKLRLDFDSARLADLAEGLAAEVPPGCQELLGKIEQARTVYKNTMREVENEWQTQRECKTYDIACDNYFALTGRKYDHKRKKKEKHDSHTAAAASAKAAAAAAQSFLQQRASKKAEAWEPVQKLCDTFKTLSGVSFDFVDPQRRKKQQGTFFKKLKSHLQQPQRLRERRLEHWKTGLLQQLKLDVDISRCQDEHVILRNELEFAQGSPSNKILVQMPVIPLPKSIHLPTTVDHSFVGRKREREILKRQLTRPAGRLLIWGDPGMGKDFLVAQTLAREVPIFRFIIWTQGTSADALSRQVFDFFDLRLSRITHGLTGQEKQAAVANWLRCNDGWLLVIEDATSAALSAFEGFLPPDAGEEQPRGHVIVTSKENMTTLPVFTNFEKTQLRRMGVPQCLEIWRALDVVNGLVNKRALQEQTWRALCADNGVTYASRANERARNKMILLLHQKGKSPGDDCSHMAELQNKFFQVKMDTKIDDFINNTLCGSPLSTFIVGKIFRHSKLASSSTTATGVPREPAETFLQRVLQQHVHDLIDDFAKLPRRNSDVHGGQHFGLVRSVWVSILRMQARCKNAKQATMLLAALAVLHPTRTPKRIFDHAHFTGDFGSTGLQEAVETLECAGLLHSVADPLVVGRIHQEVQRIVEEEFVLPVPGRIPDSRIEQLGLPFSVPRAQSLLRALVNVLDEVFVSMCTWEVGDPRAQAVIDLLPVIHRFWNAVTKSPTEIQIANTLMRTHMLAQKFGIVHKNIHNSAAALTVVRESSDFLDSNLGATHEDALKLKITLVDLLNATGDSKLAAQLLKSVEASGTVWGAEDATKITARRANILVRQGKQFEAETMLDAVVAKRRQIHDMLGLANALCSNAMLKFQMSRQFNDVGKERDYRDRAQKLMQEALDTVQDLPDVSIRLGVQERAITLAMILQHGASAWSQLIETAESIVEVRSKGHDKFDFAASMEMLASLEAQHGDPEKARKWREKAETERKETLKTHVMASKVTTIIDQLRTTVPDEKRETLEKELLSALDDCRKHDFFDSTNARIWESQLLKCSISEQARVAIWTQFADSHFNHGNLEAEERVRKATANMGTDEQQCLQMHNIAVESAHGARFAKAIREMEKLRRRYNQLDNTTGVTEATALLQKFRNDFVRHRDRGHLRLQSCVQLRNLSRGDYNGQRCVVRAVDRHRKRYIVLLDSGKEISVAFAKLTLP